MKVTKTKQKEFANEDSKVTEGNLCLPSENADASSSLLEVIQLIFNWKIHIKHCEAFIYSLFS